MRRVPVWLPPLLGCALSGCAVPPPSGPRVLALPPEGKSFEQFRDEEAGCRQYAQSMLGGVPAPAGQAVAGAALGTGLGAVAGGLIGGAAGNAGTGAAVGAGVGLLTGTAVGAGAARATGADAQRRYDMSYTQCMTARGNPVTPPAAAYPVYGVVPAYAYSYPYPYAWYTYRAGPVVVPAAAVGVVVR